MPRGVLECKATDVDDPTEDPRFGRVGKQTIRDTGPLTRERMETIEDDLLEHSLDFIDRAHAADKPFLFWHNTTRMHVWTHLSERWKDKTGLGLVRRRHAGAGLGRRRAARQARRAGHRRQHDRRLHQRQRLGEVHLAGRRHVAVPRREGPGLGGRLPRTVRDSLARHDPRRAGAERHHFAGGHRARPSWPRSASRTSRRSCWQGYEAGDKHFRVHLDGYNQLPYLTGEVDESPRHEFFYYGEHDLFALRYNNWKVHFQTKDDWFAGAC